MTDERMYVSVSFPVLEHELVRLVCDVGEERLVLVHQSAIFAFRCDMLTQTHVVVTNSYEREEKIRREAFCLSVSFQSLLSLFLLLYFSQLSQPLYL